MKSVAANILGNPADAEDAVQEAMLKAYRGVSRFRGGASVSTWLYRILLNTCYDSLRQSRRRRPRGGPDAAVGGSGGVAARGHPRPSPPALDREGADAARAERAHRVSPLRGRGVLPPRGGRDPRGRRGRFARAALPRPAASPEGAGIVGSVLRRRPHEGVLRRSRARALRRRAGGPVRVRSARAELQGLREGARGLAQGRRSRALASKDVGFARAVACDPPAAGRRIADAGRAAGGAAVASLPSRGGHGRPLRRRGGRTAGLPQQRRPRPSASHTGRRRRIRSSRNRRPTKSKTPRRATSTRSKSSRVSPSRA